MLQFPLSQTANAISNSSHFYKDKVVIAEMQLILTLTLMFLILI